MHIHQDRPASSGQWLRRHDLLNFITTLYEGDLHAKRVLSLANATVGVLTSASLAIHAVGRGLAQAMGTLTKHGVKQVDRLLSNRGVDVWGDVFGDRVIASAILDRILHHATTISIRGDSYRLKDKLKSGVVKPTTAAT